MYDGTTMMMKKIRRTRGEIPSSTPKKSNKTYDTDEAKKEKEGMEWKKNNQIIIYKQCANTNP